jgi:hypothetical protein
MPRRGISIAASMVLAAGALFASVSLVAATGNCTTAVATFYEHVNFAGATRTYCYLGLDAGDTNIETESTSTPMGPLSDGTYKADWDSLESGSGVSSMWFWEDTGDAIDLRLCVYYGPDNSGYLNELQTNNTGHSMLPWENDGAGSWRFRSGVCS